MFNLSQENKKLEKYLILIGWVLFSFSIATSNLGGLAGFNLNSSLAMADRFLETGKLFYSLGEVDHYAYSQIYFPGFAIVAIPFAYLFSSNAVDALHVLSSIFILVFLGLLVRRSCQFGVNFNIASISVPLIVISFMPAILWYAADFKPDIFLISIYLICDAYIESSRKVLTKSLVLLVFTLVGLLIKQQFLGLWIGLMVVIAIWSRGLERAVLLLTGLVGLCGAIVILSSVDGLYLHSIKSLSFHNALHLVNFGSLIYRSIIQCWPVLIGLILYFYSCIEVRITTREKKYLVVCLMWLFVRVPNLLMEGSTEENFFTALIIFLPLSLLGYTRTFLVQINFKKILILSLASIFAILSAMNFSRGIIESIGRFSLKNDVVKYVKKEHSNEGIVFDEGSYAIVREFRDSIKVSTLVVDTFGIMGDDISKFKDDFANGSYPVYITSSRSGYDPHSNWMGAENFYRLEKIYSYRNESYFIYDYIGTNNKKTLK